MLVDAAEEEEQVWHRVTPWSPGNTVTGPNAARAPGVNAPKRFPHGIHS